MKIIDPTILGGSGRAAARNRDRVCVRNAGPAGLISKTGSAPSHLQAEPRPRRRKEQ
jgi:hypothetical protein